MRFSSTGAGWCKAIGFLLLTAISSCSFSSNVTLCRIQTPQGNIWFRFHPQTPNHRDRFMELVQNRFFDSLTFNRVIPDFVVQGGCPDTREGFPGSPYLTNPEFSPELRHIPGAVGAGRDDNPAMESAICQFYIVDNPKGLPRLDDRYTVFGQVTKGLGIVHLIANMKRDSSDAPLVPQNLRLTLKTQPKWVWKLKGHNFSREFYSR